MCDDESTLIILFGDFLDIFGMQNGKRKLKIKDKPIKLEKKTKKLKVSDDKYKVVQAEEPAYEAAADDDYEEPDYGQSFADDNQDTTQGEVFEDGENEVDDDQEEEKKANDGKYYSK